VNRKKGLRKFLASILAVTMIMTSVPTSVYADEDIPAAVSEDHSVGTSESGQEPAVLKNNTGADITFITAAKKEAVESGTVTNSLKADEIFAKDETVKFYADYVADGEYVLVIKCNDKTYYINTFDYFATDLSKETSIEIDRDADIMYLKGIRKDGTSFEHT
jgi:hypothetical protein